MEARRARPTRVPFPDAYRRPSGKSPRLCHALLRERGAGRYGAATSRLDGRSRGRDRVKRSRYVASKTGALACGAHHSAVVDGGGQLWTWGWTEHGRLGRGSEEDDDDDGNVAGAPDLASLPGPGCCIAVACGASHTIVAADDGSVYGCGRNDWGQAIGRKTPGAGVWRLAKVRLAPRGALPFRAVQVAAGLGHSVAVDAEGAAKAWGFGEDGQLGHGAEASASGVVDVDLSAAGPGTGPAKIVQVEAGGTCTVAVAARELGDGLEAARRRRRAANAVARWCQARTRGAAGRVLAAAARDARDTWRRARLRDATVRAIDARDAGFALGALESCGDDYGEDAQRCRDVVRRLAVREALEEALEGALTEDALRGALGAVAETPDADGRASGRSPAFEMRACSSNVPSTLSRDARILSTSRRPFWRRSGGPTRARSFPFRKPTLRTPQATSTR